MKLAPICVALSSLVTKSTEALCCILSSEKVAFLFFLRIIAARLMSRMPCCGWVTRDYDIKQVEACEQVLADKVAGAGGVAHVAEAEAGVAEPLW